MHGFLIFLFLLNIYLYLYYAVLAHVGLFLILSQNIFFLNGQKSERAFAFPKYYPRALHIEFACIANIFINLTRAWNIHFEI